MGMNIGVGYPQNYIGSFLGIGCPSDYKITAYSNPDWDKWGPDCAWSANDWITWHKKMVSEFGKDKADTNWANAYDQSSYGAKEIAYGVQNNEFKSYVQAQGLANKSTILAKLYRAEVAIDAVGEPFRNVGGAIVGITQIAETGTKSIDKLAQWFPYIVVAGVMLIGFLIYKQGSIKSVLK